jgi:hypothetical protein
MRKKTRVRFNLGAGRNYMKWKVEYPDGGVEYHHPTDVQLVMIGCTMKNHRKTAQKIYEGASKTVCAWVLCDSVQIKTRDFESDNPNRIRYNPRIQPNWVLNGEIVDGQSFDELFSVDYGIYVKEKHKIYA